ncbi:MAG: nucleotidyltransferase family protein [Sedimentisphaerales bacterium]|nr:nucleotidyltransferase family protein [Sedimentisphaerales bacterium]
MGILELKIMTKEIIKEKLLNAVKSNPNIAEIKYVAIFGSYVNGSPRDDSDVDVLIDFYPQATVGLFKYIDLQQYLSQSLGKNVDLLTPQAISKYFRDQVLKEAELIYEG